MPIPWSLPLQLKRGAPSLLCGIDVYHDFDWREEIGHSRAAFQRGQKLAEMVLTACPSTKIPALLLTTMDRVEDHTVETDEYYIVVVPIREYLADSAPNPAASFFAKRLTAKVGAPALHRITDLVRSAKDLDAILHEYLDEEALRRWAEGNVARIHALQRLSSEYRSVQSRGTVATEEVVDTLQKLESLPSELLDALVALVNRAGDAAVQNLAEGLTSTTTGRIAAAEALADCVTDRIRDARNTAREYRALASDPMATETDLQQYIERYPWILGLEYVKCAGRRQVVRGAVDFLVQRHDGFHDFLELKGPNADLVRTLPVTSRTDMPNPPSGFTLGPELGQALAQVQYYREMFTHQEGAMEIYGIRRTRYPRALIVLGRHADLDEQERVILHQLNQSLHRIEILAYDVLADRAEAQLDNVERLLARQHKLR